MRGSHTYFATVVGTDDATGYGIFEFDASVVILRGERLNIWVGGDHYVSDPEGCIQRGQFLLVETPESGAVARIVEPNAPDAPDDGRPVKLELEIRWDTTSVDTVPAVEYWSRTDLETEIREGDDTLSARELDDSFARYIRPTNR